MVLEGGNFGHFATARPEELAADDRRRKLNTFRRFLRRLPFSLRYAPRETFATIWALTKGNYLKRMSFRAKKFQKKTSTVETSFESK